MAELVIGKVSDFFAKPVVAGISLSSPLKVGDKIHVRGYTTDVELTVDSIQINNVSVQKAKAGDAVGVKVPSQVRKGDMVYQVVID